MMDHLCLLIWTFRNNQVGVVYCNDREESLQAIRTAEQFFFVVLFKVVNSRRRRRRLPDDISTDDGSNLQQLVEYTAVLRHVTSESRDAQRATFMS